MNGYILEMLVGEGWRRPSKTYWTREQADAEAEKLIKKSLARRVRILNVRVDLADAADELTWTPRPKRTRAKGVATNG